MQTTTENPFFLLKQTPVRIKKLPPSVSCKADRSTRHRDSPSLSNKQTSTENIPHCFRAMVPMTSMYSRRAFALLLFVSNATGFAPTLRVHSVVSTTAKTRLMVKAPEETVQRPHQFCIPLEEIRLSDLPKVGGYVHQQHAKKTKSIWQGFAKPFCFGFTGRILTQPSFSTLPSKTASLGEMIQTLTPLGVAVPGGFAVSSTAYDAVLDQFQLRERLTELLKGVDVSNLPDLADRGRRARHMIMQAGLPPQVRREIEEAYEQLAHDDSLSVAVRSSATAEDLPTASFAGQQASFLNVVGAHSVADSVLECLASVFTDRAITYRVHNNFDRKFITDVVRRCYNLLDYNLTLFSLSHVVDMQVKGSVVVQRMVRSDLSSAGVAFTLDPDTGFRDVIVITGSYGLGESVVGGKVDPDEVQVFKPMIGKAQDPIIRRRIGRKQTSIVYTKGISHQRTKTVETTEAAQGRPCFTDEDANILAKWCLDIENHYSKVHGQATPMDIEWAKDGITGELFIVQARPETVRSRQKHGTMTQTIVKGGGNSMVEGTAIGNDAATGKARVIHHLDDISQMEQGDILVAEITDPDWVPAIRMASAVVTNRGGRTCHAAIVSRELGVPCIVGTKDATNVLKTGAAYTVDCSKGSTGKVLEGGAIIEKTEFSAQDLPSTRTQLKVILADPDNALNVATRLPTSGVGLVRQEFVVANHIGVHPNAVLFPEKVSEEDRKKIDKLARNDESPEAFFVRKLSEGIGSIAAAFYPKPIIVRLGDFKSNEYWRLIGGQGFEPIEEVSFSQTCMTGYICIVYRLALMYHFVILKKESNDWVTGCLEILASRLQRCICIGMQGHLTCS